MDKDEKNSENYKEISKKRTKLYKNEEIGKNYEVNMQTKFKMKTL